MKKAKTFEGKPCIKCKSTERYSISKACNNCRLLRNREWKLANKEKILVTRENYKERAAEIAKEYHKNNREVRRNKSRLYALNNKDKLLKYWKTYDAEHKERKKQYRKDNPHVQRNIDAKRHAAKMQRIPSWVDLDEIKKIYKNCPIDMAVDHIYPLQGKLVSGLHVANNLQYLTKSENSSKGNRFEPEFIINETRDNT
jgi:hypothetical protein